MCRWTAGDFSPLCRHQTPTERPTKLLRLPSLHLSIAGADALLDTASASDGTNVTPENETACGQIPHLRMVRSCTDQTRPKNMVVLATLSTDSLRRYPNMQNSQLYTYYREGSEKYTLLLKILCQMGPGYCWSCSCYARWPQVCRLLVPTGCDVADRVCPWPQFCPPASILAPILPTVLFLWGKEPTSNLTDDPR